MVKSPSGLSAPSAGSTIDLNHTNWPSQTFAGSHYMSVPNVNVAWQDTSSNATYCSASAALAAS